MATDFLPHGPALPPGVTMKCTTRFLGRTRIKIINEKFYPALVEINEIERVIEAATESKSGELILSGFMKFGQTFIIVNKAEWVLKVE